MKSEIIMVGPMPVQLMTALDDAYQVHRLWEADDPNALLAEVAPRVRAVATAGALGASAQLMDALPNLEIISSCSVGVDAIDLNHARSRGIAVTNTPDVLNDDVADLAIALMLAVSRQLCAGDRFIRNGQWLLGEQGLGRRMSGKRLGILGLGRIGRAIARRARAFDMPIAYHQRHASPDCPFTYYDNLIELGRNSDYLVCIVPGGAGTRHLVDRAVLDALGPEGVLINIARGSVVDEKALVEALLDGRLGGAGLDVFAREPNAPQALLTLDNVVLAPHVGSATQETRAAMSRLVIDNLRAHFGGKPLLTPVQ